MVLENLKTPYTEATLPFLVHCVQGCDLEFVKLTFDTLEQNNAVLEHFEQADRLRILQAGLLVHEDKQV